MAQFARPDSTVAFNSWVNDQGTTNLHGAIDEATASDADYILGDNNTNDSCDVGLSDVADPNSSTGHVVRYRYSKSGAGGNTRNLVVLLWQASAATPIASQVHNDIGDAWTAGSFTLSAAEADAITDYTDLKLRFSATGTTGGSPSLRHSVRVSWAELEVPDASGGGRNINVGLVTETDTAQVFSQAKAKDVAQSQSTNTALTLSSIKTVTVGLVTETDTAQGFAAKRKQKQIGQGQQTDAALSITVSQTRSVDVGQVVETDTAFRIDPPHTSEYDQALPIAVSQGGGPQNVPVGQVTEASLAQPVARSKALGVGQGSESDQSLSVARTKAQSVQTSTETDESQPISASKARNVGQTTEVDAPQSINHVKSVQIGLVTESNAPVSVDKAKNKALNQAVETDLAQPVSTEQTQNVPVNQAIETDTAQQIDHTKAQTASQAQETDTSQPIVAKKAYPVGIIVEVDTSQSITVSDKKPLGQVSETNTARTITVSKAYFLGFATETDTAQSVVQTGTTGGADPGWADVLDPPRTVSVNEYHAEVSLNVLEATADLNTYEAGIDLVDSPAEASVNDSTPQIVDIATYTNEADV